MSDSFPGASDSGGGSFPHGSDPQAAYPTQDGTASPQGSGGNPLLFRRYRVLRELGRGGMGVVVLAQDTALDIPVAVKLVPDVVVKDTESVMDLRKEVLRGMALMHTSIVRTHNFEKDEGGAGIVMEYVDGDSLSDLKMRQPSYCFDPEQILPWIEQLCSALDYAHREARIVHRDLKPRNLMLTKSGKLKIADFGTAAIITDSVSRHSMEGNISGTLSYMSPQQAEGKRPTILDDIHAVGATIYELLTGKPPFFRGSPMAIHTQVISMVPPPMSERREELEVTGRAPIPTTWEETVAACLAKDPAMRPQSAIEIVTRLKTVPAAIPPSPAETVVRAAVPQPPTLNLPPPPLPISVQRPQPVPAAEPKRRPGIKLWLAAAIFLLAVVGSLIWGLVTKFGSANPNKRVVEEPSANKQLLVERAPEVANASTPGVPKAATANNAKSSARLGLPTQVIFGRSGSTRFITRGLLDGEGKVDPRTLDPKWKFVTPFYGDLLNVQQDGKWGMINDAGKVVHEPQWEDEPFLHERSVLNYSRDFAFIQRGGKFGFIEKSGRIVSEPQWDDCYRFSEGLAAVKRDGKHGYIDPTGAVAIDLVWTAAGAFANGLAPVSRNNKTGYIDKSGTVVIPLEWDECLPFTDQLAAVRRGQKWGYINRAGKLVIPLELDGATPFSEEMAGTMRGNKWGYIDRTGVERVRPKFDAVGLFVMGVTPVMMNGRAGLIDRAGASVVEPQFEAIRISDNAMSVVTLGGKEGLVDRTGKQILAPEWNLIYVGHSQGGDLPLGFVAGLKRLSATSTLIAIFTDQGRKIWEGNVPTIDENAPHPDGPRTHRVPGNFETITKALAAAHPGDTIDIGPGKYNESLSLVPGVRLIGAGSDKTFIRADATVAAIYVRDCPTGLISDLTLEHIGTNNSDKRTALLYLKNSKVEVLRCQIRNSAAHGVNFDAGDQSTMTRCTVTGSSWSAITVEAAEAAPVLRENRIYDNAQVGIFFDMGAGGIAEGNTIEANNSTGIVVKGANTRPELRNNICRKNSRDGIRFLDGGGGIADGNTCEQNKWCGIAASGRGTAPALTNNRCNNNTNSGIAIEKQVAPTAFSGNTASGNKAKTQIDRAATFN